MISQLLERDRVYQAYHLPLLKFFIFLLVYPDDCSVNLMDSA